MFVVRLWMWNVVADVADCERMEDKKHGKEERNRILREWELGE